MLCYELSNDGRKQVQRTISQVGLIFCLGSILFFSKFRSPNFFYYWLNVIPGRSMNPVHPHSIEILP